MNQQDKYMYRCRQWFVRYCVFEFIALGIVQCLPILSDKSYINRGFYGSNKNFPDPAQPVRKRHSYTSLDTSNFGKSTALSTQGDTPLTSQGNPVGNIRQSPRSSRPSSLRSSSRSPRSVSTNRSQQSPRSTDGQQMENDIMEGFDNIAALPSDTDSYTSTSPTSRNMKPSVSTDPSDIHLWSLKLRENTAALW